MNRLWQVAGCAALLMPPTCAGESGVMTKITVRLLGPGIKSGSFSALPKTIYRQGDRYARIEDPPDARQKLQKLTIFNGRDAYSVNLIDRKGTHALEPKAGAPRLPIVLPFDPKHRLPSLDAIEFGSEVDFFEDAGSRKAEGPPVNGKPTDLYELTTSSGPARLTVRRETGAPIFLTWPTADGEYKYEYITYEDVHFQPSLFAKPPGIVFRELPADPDQ